MTSWRAELVERVASALGESERARCGGDPHTGDNPDLNPWLTDEHRIRANAVLSIAIPAILERAAISVACVFDDRPRSRAGHPSQMDWDDGYREATSAAATALRSFKDNPDVEA